jgi:hypothetical protein
VLPFKSKGNEGILTQHGDMICWRRAAQLILAKADVVTVSRSLEFALLVRAAQVARVALCPAARASDALSVLRDRICADAASRGHVHRCEHQQEAHNQTDHGLCDV